MSEPTASYEYPFQNPDVPLEERLDNLLSLMTLEEKIVCLSTRPDVPRLGITATGHFEGLHGLAVGGPGGWGGKEPIPTTTFPQAIGLGETWDPEAVRQVAAIEGYEARHIAQSERYHRSSLVIRAPNADLGRDPRWGRTEECYGEDPYFNGTMTVAFIKGLQGDHPVYWQAAALMKHFLANSNENGRESSSSDFDERLFREYYCVPFRMGIIEGGSRAYMAAYNSMNGVPMSIHPVLKDVTVNEWGNDGIICTDGGAMKLLVTDHKAFPELSQATAEIVKAGIGQFLDDYAEPAREAVAAGILTEEDMTPVLKGNFRVMIRLGLLDPPERVPYAHIHDEIDPWTTEKHKSAVRSVTQKSLVLLKNQDDLLPLGKSVIKSIAVVGPRADEVLLDWYSGTSPYTVTPLAGIREKVGPDVAVHTAKDGDEAVALAKQSDVVIVCVGNHPVCDAGWAQCPDPSEGKEAVDRKSLDLTHEDLIKQILAVNPKTIVALISSFPYAIHWTQEHVPAIIHMTQNSQEAGNALADALFGDHNPAGRLVQTWPKSLDQLPPMMDYDIRHGRTYLYFQGEPLYPFGFGSSYTQFAYSNLTTSAETLDSDSEFTVSVDVNNVGKRAGDEVVQLYVSHLHSAVERPIQELARFKRIPLEPGETKTVSMRLTAEQFAYWDTLTRGFVIEPGQVKIRIGSSSAHIALEKTIEVTRQGVLS